MTKLIAKWFIGALSLLLAAYLVAGISVASFYIALIVAALLGFLHLIVRPVIVVLTLPINIMTLGLFTFVIDALFFWFVASFVEGFYVTGFIAALLGALVVSVVSSVGNMMFGLK